MGMRNIGEEGHKGANTSKTKNKSKSKGARREDTHLSREHWVVNWWELVF